MTDTAPRKKCFVVMGFGEKTDFQQQKKFDLDKSYRIIIKKAVEEAGLECIRADDIVHSGIIDKPMYQMLLQADLVVADLSTSNANAIYELGVRHALRPNTTIVIAESNFKFPYDVKSLLIRTYEHLGSGIDAEVADDFRAKLIAAIKQLVDQQDVDSPVYTFLPTLQKPTESTDNAAPSSSAAPAPVAVDQKVSTLLDLFREARAAEEWQEAAMYLEKLKAKRPGDPYILQQLALATYKGKLPNKQAAVENARTILSELNPSTSNDPETLGIWGSIHKQLWELNGKSEDLEESIRAYGKGFYLKDDYYNGINHAFMLNVRGSVSTNKPDAIADFVWAERVRQRVIQLCEGPLKEPDNIKDDDGNPDKHQIFWLRATLVEALIGTGQTDKAASKKEEAIKEAPETWMPKTLNDQLAKLEVMLAKDPR
jgi:tetratricopeptide (TPR) repeat protein